MGKLRLYEADSRASLPIYWDEYLGLYKAGIMHWLKNIDTKWRGLHAENMVPKGFYIKSNQRRQNYASFEVNDNVCKF